MNRDTASARAAQAQFDRQAASYSVSSAHSGGEGLSLLKQYAALGRYDTIVDIATGAGFTAFALAPYARRVVATDIATGMLVQTRRLAAEHNPVNVALAMAEAESLPFTSGSLDLVSCRQAAHHFHDLPGAVAEIRRVLKPGGVFLLSDTVAPEGDREAGWLNDVELRRDSSNQRDWRPSEWLALLEDTRLQVTHRSMAKVHLEFNDWVLRSATPQRLIEPLRRDFISSKPSVVKAFGIRPEGKEIHFHWDVLVVRAVRG